MKKKNPNLGKNDRRGDFKSRMIKKQILFQTNKGLKERKEGGMVKVNCFYEGKIIFSHTYKKKV